MSKSDRECERMTNIGSRRLAAGICLGAIAIMAGAAEARVIRVPAGARAQERTQARAPRQ